MYLMFAIIRVKNDRLHACIYILCNSRWEKFGNIRNNLILTLMMANSQKRLVYM